MSLTKIGPWYFPEGDKVCGPASIQEAMLIEPHWLPAVNKLSVCVQAGGNCGLFPSKLACFFDAVYTAEPDCDNFMCLALNCPAPNVYAFRGAFGKEAGTIGLHKIPDNAGGHWVEGKGTIPVLPIDALNLPDCNLLQLDIEGGEFNALLGAEKTIEKYHPTLIIEWKGHVKRFGQTNEEMEAWIVSKGYRHHGMVWRDRVWVHP